MCSFVLELAEDVCKNTTVLVVGDLGLGVKSALDGEALAVGGFDDDVLASLQITTLGIN